MNGYIYFSFITLLLLGIGGWLVFRTKNIRSVIAAFFDDSNDPLIILDGAKIFYVNKQAADFLGVANHAKLHGLAINSILSKKSVETLNRNANSPANFKLEYLKNNGKGLKENTTYISQCTYGSRQYRVLRIKLVEDCLADHKDMLKQVINLVPHQIYLKDHQGKFVFVNHAFAENFALTAEEMPGKTAFDIYPNEQAQKIADVEMDVMKRGRLKFITEAFQEKMPENITHIHSVKVPFLFQEENQIGILNVSIDVSDFKAAEQSIRSSELKYKMLMEQASDGIYLYDVEGNILDANAKACEIFGYELAEFTKLTILQLASVSARSGDTVSAESLTKAQPVVKECMCRRKDGSDVVVEISSSLLDDGRYQAIVRDITQRKKLEKVLKDNEYKFRMLIENSSDLVAILSEDLRIKFVGDSCQRILGYKADSMLGKVAFEFVHPNDIDMVSKSLADVLANPGENQVLDGVRLRNNKGLYHSFEVVGVNLLKDEVVNGIIVNCHDITKRVESERELLTINHELDSFVYKASHDLKAPLRSLTGLVKLARLESSEPILDKYFDMMQNSIDGLSAFIKELIEFSRNSRPGLERVEINFEKMVGEALNNLKFAENAEKVKVHKDVKVKGKFYSDDMRISSVISNLLSNAYKYHRYEDNNPYINIRITADENRAEIIIEDNGQGIEVIYQDRVFDMFFRASEDSDGSGLGLYIVKNNVAKLGGELALESIAGKGSKFIVHIPNLIKDLQSKNE
ncbi:PAS domain-containing sensor histidine kinase [Cytophagaceae bacterium ABcell3]|nr:PAS domain-containing sensor histidine kinase [Cytophagaceae bacterium ABcell3]